MRCRKNIFLLWVFTAVLATFMLWTGPAVAARGQHAPAEQSPASPHWKTWKVVKSPSPGSNLNVLNGVAVLSAKDAWAVGNYYKKNKPQPTLIEHWNGSQWSIVKSPNPGAGYNVLNGVAALSAKNIWAVGYYTKDGGADQTLTEHWNGSQWSVVTSPNATPDGNLFQAVAAVSAKDVWAVGISNDINKGVQTLIERWNGTKWSIVTSPSPGYLDGVAAVSARDVWAVGTVPPGLTLIEHWNGSHWSVVTSPNPASFLNALSGVAAISARDVWAVGHYSDGRTSKTLTEHWDGSRWSVIASANLSDRNSLIGVAALAKGKVWAVGNYYNGSVSQTLIEFWNRTEWRVVKSPNAGTSHNFLNGVAALAKDKVWSVGNYYNDSVSQTLTELYS